MRTTYSMDEITGIFNGPVAGSEIPLAIDPALVGIVVGDVVENETKEVTGAVTVVGDESVTADITFSPGDFYTITLATEWTAKTTDGTVIDVECNVCGFSFPSQKLVDGICSVCWDDEKES